MEGDIAHQHSFLSENKSDHHVVFKYRQYRIFFCFVTKYECDGGTGGHEKFDPQDRVSIAALRGKTTNIPV